MPKKWNNNHPTSRNNPEYFCHDDRGGANKQNKQKRRVLFKTPAHARGHYTMQKKLLLMENRFDDDVSMGESSQSKGRRSPLLHQNMIRRGILNHKQRIGSNITWFKVIIPYGNKYPREFILKCISDLISPHVFVPIKFTVAEKDVHFYLDNEEDANRIQECSNKIVTNNGFKFKILVRPGYPFLEAKDLTDTFKEKIKLALSKRFFSTNNALDLSNLHRDPELVTDYFCALFRPLIMNTVLEIIAEHIPNVMALNFNDNKLVDLRSLKTLKNQFQNLKILYLGNNRIKEVYQLDMIKDLELQELVLQGNPLCNRFKSRQNDYIWICYEIMPKGSFKNFTKTDDVR